MFDSKSPEQIVRAFLQCWGGSREHVINAFVRFVDPDFIWDNVGYVRTIGLAEVPLAFADFEQRLPFDRMSVDLKLIACSGSSVLTERIDNFHRADGSIGLAVPVMGVMDVEGGKIVHWRDYCDFALFRDFPEAPARVVVR